MRWQGRAKALHHNDHDHGHDNRDHHDNGAPGVPDAELDQPRRAQFVHADAGGARSHGVHAQAPRRRVGTAAIAEPGTGSWCRR